MSASATVCAEFQLCLMDGLSTGLPMVGAVCNGHDSAGAAPVNVMSAVLACHGAAPGHAVLSAVRSNHREGKG